MQVIEFHDANVTLGEQNVVPRNRYIDAATLKRRLGECGITSGLAIHNASIEGDPSDGNSLIADALASWPGFAPVWSVVPLSTGELGTQSELARSLARARVCGVVCYPQCHRYSPEAWQCHDLFEVLEAMRMPVFTRAEIDMSWDQIAATLSAHPDLELILRNCGYASTRALFQLLDSHRHVRIETSRFFPFRGIEETVTRFGARRLVFGSGAPAYSPGAAVAPVLLADIDDEARRLVAGDTLRGLIKGIRYDA